jgi:GNAT superfamily N-acetyltransferase
VGPPTTDPNRTVRPGAGRLRVLTHADGERVASVWNDAFAASHPLGPRTWSAWWASPDADPTLTWGVEDDRGRLRGALLARAPRRPWAPPDLAHVSLFAVDAAARGRGVGDLLWRTAAEALRARGRRRIRVGADPERLVPGVPFVAPPETWRFLRTRGIRPGGLEADLWLDLRDPAIDRVALPKGVSLGDADPADAVAFVTRTFPGRWADEVAGHVKAGGAVLTLRRTVAADGAGASAAARAGDTIGFCLASQPGDPVLGPSLGWAGEPWGPADAGVAGLGPLGVHPAARGGGFGLALVAGAARWQRDHGHRAAIIDWTTLADFYGRLGARAWRVYQRAEGDL